MGETNDIAELDDMLQRLRATDTAFRVFGSKAHGYSLRPTLSESELAALEFDQPRPFARRLSPVSGDGLQWFGRPVLRADSALR